MAELAAVVFDDRPAATRFRSRVEALAETGALRLEGVTVLRRRLDDRLTVDHARPSDLDTFWGLFIGLVLWPYWLGMTSRIPPPTAAVLDAWGVTPRWADDVARNMGPGDVAVLFLADQLPTSLIAAIRATDGDLFHLPLTDRMKATLTEAFGGHRVAE